MPTFDFSSPGGKIHGVTGPEGSTAGQAWSVLQQHLKVQGLRQDQRESSRDAAGSVKS
jgi:hypothetical protein